MSQPAVQVEKLCKAYRLGQTCAGDRSLGNALRRSAANIASLMRGKGISQAASGKRFHALRDVTFSVQPGEVMGIVGANGAGKSTLLKILSRITEPTSGRAVIRGRMASLLEVGTGFHPELTGRENVFLNGTILGMPQREVRAKFDEIVDFSGVEKFLDTPVKRYSSGMRVRLAFAVAAHLEPQILVVDEVLAVGDAAFQKKCLGKMQDMTDNTGRTILFVSHNMTAVENLCQKTVWLDSGRMVKTGPTKEVVHAYLRRSHDVVDGPTEIEAFRQTGMEPIIRRFYLTDDQGHSVGAVSAGAALNLVIDYEAEYELRNPCFGIGIETAEGQRLIFLQTRVQLGLIEKLPRRGTIQCQLPRLPLTPGSYTFSIGCSTDRKQRDRLERAYALEVLPHDVFGTGHLPLTHQGRILVDAKWILPGINPSATLCEAS